ncbi:hypothetical protein [Actinomadura sp. 21ATH]|uniref:hypothetical protein n=1 Tax=Actinomadura sp. 21ATH TaxID=1735444 RepID=UPI0035BF07B8
MDLVRAWGTAVAVYLVASLVTTIAAVGSDAAADGLTATGDRVVWNAVPMALTFAAMTVLAGLAHPGPRRSSSSRHALAVFAVPAVLGVLGVVFGLATGPAVSAWSGGAGALVGTAAGWGVLVALGRLRPAT